MEFIAAAKWYRQTGPRTHCQPLRQAAVLCLVVPFLGRRHWHVGHCEPELKSLQDFEPDRLNVMMTVAAISVSKAVAHGQRGAGESTAGAAEKPDPRLLTLLPFAIQQGAFSELLQRLPEHLAELLACGFCGVATRSPQTNELMLKIAQRGLGGEWSAWKDISLAGEKGGTLTQCVLNTSKPLALADCRSAAQRDPCLDSRGVVSALVVPLSQDGEQFGTLGVYHNAPRHFGAADVRLLETAASLLAASFERQWLEQQLDVATTIIRAERQSGESSFARLNQSLQVVELNSALESLGQYALAEICDRTFVSVYTAYDDATALVNEILQLKPGGPKVQLECALHSKHGNIRRMSWSFHAVELPSGVIEYFVSGVDVTERHEANQAVERAQQTTNACLDVVRELQTTIEAGDLEQIKRVMSDAIRNGRIDPHGIQSSQLSQGRRHDERRRLRCPQMIAPYQATGFPNLRAFYNVMGQDLSTGGISFFMPERPAETEFVIMLGPPAKAIYVHAIVSHCRLVEEGGRPQYLVGCEFHERLRGPKF